MSRRIMAREIAEAIRDGFLMCNSQASITNAGFVYSVHVWGFDGPFVIERSHVDVPEWATDLWPGIRLDVQAVIASF